MRIAFIDYETFFDDDYGLRKIDGRKGSLRTEYLHDKRFKAHGMAVSIDDSSDEWVDGAHLREFWNDVGPHVDAVCAHNGIFDHAITARFYTAKRFFLLDTLSMAQGVHGAKHPDQSMSLAALSRYYWPDDMSMWKLDTGVDPLKGHRVLSPEQRQYCIRYARQDNRICRGMFRRLLAEDYPWETELHNIHLTLAMGVFPVLQMDSILAARINAQEIAYKKKVVEELGIERADLRSGEKFAEILRRLGVDPPMKPSPKKPDTMIYAFAAKDPGMMELQEHEDLRVQAVISARIGEKASQMESRAATFARLPSPLPVPMRYAGAHTGRHAGDEYNMLNLKRGSDLRACIVAPPGHVIIDSDLAQAELMLNAWWSEEQWLVDLLAAQGDVYVKLASLIYGRTITKADEDERYVGKQGELASQYGAGYNKVLLMLKQKGVKGADLDLARKINRGYRSSHLAIVRRWDWLRDQGIPALAGLFPAVECNGVRFEKWRVVLPSGRCLHYPELQVNEEGDWVYKFRTPKGRVVWKKIWHGLALENLIQAMQFDLFSFHARILDNEGLPLVHAVYDSSLFVVPEEKAKYWAARVEAVQSMRPDWCKGLPCRGEAKIGPNYRDTVKWREWCGEFPSGETGSRVHACSRRST